MLDLDNNKLEVYQGFNTSGVSVGRFADLECNDNDRRKENGNDTYDPVTLVAEYSFFELPTVEQIVADIDAQNPEE